MDYARNATAAVNSGLQYVGESAAVKTTFVDPIAAAHATLVEAVNRLSVVTDRLCGATPPTQPGVEGKISAVPNGLFDDIADRGRDMLRRSEALHEMIGRIERALP
jgi:hypothetical protein